MFGKPYLKYYRRRRIRQQAFPESWRQILKRRVPYFRRMPADLQLQLKKHIQVFLAEKVFVGCDGLEVTDEMRVTIAAQACLLLLNRNTDYYPGLSQILIYPDAFIVNKKHTDAMGLVTEQRQVLSGESWQQGQVILSWQNTVQGSEVPDDGHNVVIHEFAHQLDQENGPANGAPILARREHYPEWSAVLRAEFEQLQSAARIGLETLFSHYGATNPAEFFAVVSEVFFEQPQAMATEHPALYQQLSRFYRVDPLTW
ncbi:zinc-dependent peptidase [Permianibacter sp. IMCC34836]|nr:zinc-dependent peptidase [Permianibacter fluminis]